MNQRIYHNAGQDAGLHTEGSADARTARSLGHSDANAAAAPNPAPEADAEDRFLPQGALGNNLSVMAGIACLLAWTELLLCFEGVLRDEVLYAGGLVHDPFFRAFTLVAACLLLGVVAANRLNPKLQLLCALFRTPGVLWGAVAAGALCSVAATLLTWYAPGVLSVAIICGAGSGLFAAWSTLAWGRVLAELDLRAALMVISGAICLQWLPLMALPLTNILAKALLIAMLAAASGILLHHEQAGLADAFEATETPKQRRHTPEPANSSAVLARMVAAMFAFSLVIQFLWCFFIKMLPGKLDVGLFPGIFAVVIAALVLIMGGVARTMERQRAYRLELVYRLCVLFCLCGAAATGVAAAYQASSELFAMYALVYLGYSLLTPTMWMLSLGYAHMCRTSATTVVGCVFGLRYLGLFAGFTIVDVLKVQGLESAGPAIMPAVVLACVAVVAVLFLVVFPERELLSLSPLLFGMSSESIENRCAQLAAEYGLTPREAEVFALLARGRDVGFICQQLFIARNTVNVHRKSIYAKMGIHSQQELLTLVEG